MAAKGLFINSTEQGFTVRGINNNFFPDNATLAYPANSVILITDESDMATFRSASNYDVLFSSLIKDININGEQVTKDSIIETFNEAANKPSGGGGGDVTGLFADASYDSQTKHINFYDKDNTLVAYVDATAFIKDGMVDSVAITNGNLVITFNTDAGKEPITIPLTDIFNPNNYYDKTTADSTFATQVVVNEEIASRIEAIREVNTALGTKADKSDTYTKTQVDTALSEKVSQTDFDTKEEVVSTALNELEENKQDKLTAGANITIDANNVISSTGGEQQQADWNQTDTTAVDYIKNKPTIPDTSEFVTKTEYNPKEVAIAKALTQLNDTKADKTDIPNLNNYYTKNETDTAIQTAVGQIDLSDYQTKEDADVKEQVVSTALNDLAANKQDALTAGNGISIQNNVISATGGGGGTQQQADWNQTDTTAVDYIKNKPTIPSQFTDVDDIQLVNALPASPSARILYLIPVQ